MRKKIIKLTTVLYIALITILSLVKLSPKPETINISYFDKIVHVGFYFTLNMLLLIYFTTKHRTLRYRRRFIVTFMAIGYGIFIEIVQHFVGRECSILDIMANSAGAISSLLIFNLLSKRVIYNR